MDAKDRSRIDKKILAILQVNGRLSNQDIADQVNSSSALTLQAKLSSTEDVDLPKTIMELQMQQTGYQAALSITAKALQPTLVDFLR